MSSEDVFSFLHDHPLLRGIPEDELRIAASSIRSIDFIDGQSLLVEGEIGTECYFIRTGNVQVSSRNLVGNSMLLAELGPGALVGEIGLLQNERRTARVTAIGDVSALCLDRQLFESFAESSPLFHESMLQTVRIRMIHRKLRNATIWSVIPDSELRGLAEVTSVRKVAKGEIIVAAGALADQFYMVSKGRLEACGRRKKTALLEGDFFGEAMLLTDTPSEVTITATEDSELLVMGKSEFLFVLRYYVPIQKQFMEILRIRTPHLISKVKYDFGAPVSEVRNSSLAKAREHWIDVLLWLGGGFIALSLLALFLNNSWLNIVVLIVGGLVGPATFVTYIRDHQLLGFRQSRLSLIFAGSAIFAAPVAWLLERMWLIGIDSSSLDFAQFRLPLYVSLIEESVKLLVCIALVRTKKVQFLMDAVVFGAAAGMGFAAVESMIYGWSHMEEASSVGMLSVLWIRALLSPFGHGAWTAIAAAGFWIGVASKQSKAFGNARAVYKIGSAILLFLIVIGLHTLWDFHFANGWAKVGMMVVIGCIDIILLYVLIRIGRREEIQTFSNMNPYVQEQLRHPDPEDTTTGELHCSGCGTLSPRSSRYCARCGHALRIK